MSKKVKGKKAKQKNPVYLPEYYILPFKWLHSKYLEDTSAIVRGGRSAVRKKYADSVSTNTARMLVSDEAFSFLFNFLSVVEAEMKELLVTHSPYYWLYLYRRVGIGSILEDGELDDASTIASIRTTVETAILKYGDLLNQTDLCLFKHISAKDLLDGLFYEVFASTGKSDAEIEAIWHLYNRNQQWVPKGYKRADHTKVYLLEGYAYEYWRATAAMRAIGKGATLYLEADGNWNELRIETLNSLILSYDRRLAMGQRYISTAKGLLSFNRKSSLINDKNVAPGLIGGQLIFATYNSRRVKAVEISSELHELGDVVTNFVPVVLDYNRFIDAHRVLEKPFQKKWGFTLRGVFLFFWSISLYVVNSRRTEIGPESLSVFHLLQRAYAHINFNLTELSRELLKLHEAFQRPADLDIEVSSSEMEAICSHFILTCEAQGQISLWSQGPRPVIVPFGSTLLIDIGGMQGILTNLFFGVREKQQDRGIQLEEILRDETHHRGFELLENRELRFNDNDYREADLVIRVGNVLVLCDCRSIERPLDYFLGKPSTIVYRNKLIDKKVDQVNSLKEFVLAKPIGRNYDFSWPEAVYSIGVLPDIEWISSEDSKYWLDKKRDLPILMSAEEMFSFLTDLKSSQAS